MITLLFPHVLGHNLQRVLSPTLLNDTRTASVKNWANSAACCPSRRMCELDLTSSPSSGWSWATWRWKATSQVGGSCDSKTRHERRPWTLALGVSLLSRQKLHDCFWISDRGGGQHAQHRCDGWTRTQLCQCPTWCANPGLQVTSQAAHRRGMQGPHLAVFCTAAWVDTRLLSFLCFIISCDNPSVPPPCRTLAQKEGLILLKPGYFFLSSGKLLLLNFSIMWWA